MDEARRFLRYVTPGIVFVIELAIYLILSQRAWTASQIQHLLSINISVLIAFLLASGGIGFLLSVLYHTLSWCPRCPLLPAPDHREMLQQAEHANYLEIILQGQPETEEKLSKKLSKEGAWRVLTAMWHERVEASDRIKDACRRTDSLADLVHGAGTAFVGSVLAAAIWLLAYLYICRTEPSSCKGWYIGFLSALVVAVLLPIVHRGSFLRTREHFQGIIQITLFDELGHEWLCNKCRPVKVHIREEDLEKHPGKPWWRRIFRRGGRDDP